MRSSNQSYSTISMIPLQTTTRELETKMDHPDEEAGMFTPLQQSSKTQDDYSVPVGYWKDGLFECCRFGFFHPSFWNATCCPQILLAQISTRQRLNWLGDAYNGDWKRTFRIVLGIVMGYWTCCIFFAPKPPEIVVVHGVLRVVISSNTDDDEPQWKQKLYDLMTVAFGIYTLVYLTKVRRAVRSRFNVPIQWTTLGSWEDCCCAFWCGCCTVAQIARHTSHYETQPASCCSSTGYRGAGSRPIVV